jgi:outer membrane protein assembly factor BamB
MTGCSVVPEWAGGEPEEEEIVTVEGERIAVMAKPEKILAVESQDETITAPSSVINLYWPMQDSGLAQVQGNLVYSNRFDKIESTGIGDGETWDIPLVTEPVIGGGALYTMDALGNITRHDIDDIDDILWQSEALLGEDETPILGGGLAYSQNRVYATSGHGDVIALDAKSGTLLWKKAIQIPIRSAPRIAYDRVFVLSVDNQLLALDTATGEVFWNHRTILETSSYLGAAAPVVGGNIVISGFSSGDVDAVRTDTGQEIWSDALVVSKRTSASTVFKGIQGDMLIEDGVLYAGTNSGVFVASNAQNGRRIWEQEIATTQTPWLAGSYLYILTSDNALVALNKRTGKVVWLRDLPADEDEPTNWFGPVMAGGNVLVVNDQETLIEIHPSTGEMIAIHEVEDDVINRPLIAKQRLYLLTRDATIHAYQ